MQNPVFDKVNPHFKSKFASLAAVRDAVVPVLARFGISLTQTYQVNGDAQYIVTTLHKSGDQVVSLVPLPPYQNSQQWASATTYIRRISMMAIAGVCGDEDDDAEQTVRPAQSFKVSPHPQPEYQVDTEVARQYADGIRSHINVNNPKGIYDLHNELRQDMTMYDAVGALLNTKEKAALKAAVASKGAAPF
jgi:hypothetical protein